MQPPAFSIDPGLDAGAARGNGAADPFPIPAGPPAPPSDPAFDIDRGHEAGAARLSAIADAARGAAGACSPAELTAALRRACSPAVLPCDGFRFATYDRAADALRYHAAFPALASGDDQTGWSAIRAGLPQNVPARAAAPAVLSAPVRAGDDTLGVIVLTRETDFDADEATFLEALASVAAPALLRVRMADALRASEGWEQRVDERTRELAHANDALEAEVQQHRAAREELLHRTRELEVIFSALPDLYFRLADDGTILSYRAGSYNGLYVDPEVFLDHRLQDVMPPDVGRRFDAARAEVRRTGQVVSMEYTLPVPGDTGEGEERAYEARIVPLMPGELAAIVRDVTDSRQAQAAVRESEESYRGLFDNLTELVYIQDLEGRFLNVNEAVLRTYGYTREELLGRTPEILAAPEVDLQATVERFARAVAGEPQRCEWWGRRKDGSVFPKDLSLARSTYFGQDAVIAVARDITERVEAEQALRAREEHFRRLIEHASDMVSIIGPDGGIRYESEAIERMFGYTVAEGAGASAWTRVHPDDHPIVAQALAAVIANPGCTGSSEFRYRHANGEWRIVEAVGKTLTDDPAEGIVINTRDVTARRLAEQALRESEERYRALIENGHDIIVILDPETGEVRYQSPSMERILGYAPGDLAERSVFDLVHPDDLPEGLATLAEAVAAPGTTHRAVYRCRHADGGWRTLETFGRTLLPESAEGGLVFNTRDITEAQEAEDALRRSERHFRRLIENAQDNIAIVDTAGTMTYMSPSSLRLLGYPPEALVGRSAFGFIHPDDQRLVADELARVFGAPGMIGHVEYRFRHHDGTWRYLEAFGQTMSPDGPEEGIVANIRDVTERRLAEEALRSATAEAEAANRAKSEFLSRMSHELRTPMNSILGFAQLLERAHLPVEQQRGVQHILTAGRHLLRLINEVLDIARIESGRQQLSLEPVRLNAVLQEALILSRPLAAQAAVSLVAMDGPGDAVFVRADRQRLVQVLLNLLSNAVKYNHRGGAVRLSWEAIEEEGGDPRVRLRVSDTGRGIAPEKQGELFVPFARLGAEYTGVEGTGLGLALSRRLVEAMGGALRLEESGPEGSAFTVELRPAADPLDGLVLRPASHGTAMDADAPAPEPVTLLYVEDNLANLSLVESILASRPGWRTIPALQGRLGADLACEHLPDLVLLDLHLPDMQGDEVLRRLRCDPRTARIPVVMISADATPRTIDRLRAEGADAYLTKPIDVDEFLSTIDRLLPVHA
ncbi:PAS domain S-box protein [Longimicrobium sp.]|uniref:PAS domain S-box protein n=1 Tax=Longimicrobium sp. TaxID=2029185 RepID=UPI002E34BAFC|nr:PAS domain S-box protein [Longimicrobium sp.]HEX6039773.1 PAS domain S-box protein [Longimicrobium sp.]